MGFVMAVLGGVLRMLVDSCHLVVCRVGLLGYWICLLRRKCSESKIAVLDRRVFLARVLLVVLRNHS